MARFNDDATIERLPLVFGEGPLTEENVFTGQADVVIDARIAGDVLGATPMDRPADVQPHGDRTVYVMLANNTRRTADQVKWSVLYRRLRNAFHCGTASGYKWHAELCRFRTGFHFRRPGDTLA